jgi:hypothetical protein
MNDPAPYAGLTPDRVLDAVESLGLPLAYLARKPTKQQCQQ